jgi:hypothetical protein
MNTELIKVEDDGQESCSICACFKLASCLEDDRVQKLNAIHGKCWSGTHHYEIITLEP